MSEHPRHGGYIMGIKLQQIRECFGGMCNWKGCTATENLEFAHRHNCPTKCSGRGRGQWNRIKDIMKHPACYILLCTTHHEVYDRETGEWKGQKRQEVPA